MPEDLYLQLQPWMHLVGRVLFSTLFIVAGLTRLVKLNDVAAMAQQKGVPSAKPLTALNGILILVGGVLVLLGWHRFIGAGLLVIALLPAPFLLHTFWKETDPNMRASETLHFLKDLALAGAALYMAAYSGMSWPMSLGG